MKKNKILIILLIALVSGCTVLKKPNRCMFIVDYIIFETLQDAVTAEDLFFQVGYETEYEEGIYDNEKVYLIEIQDITILDLEFSDKRIFPIWYKDNIVRFCLEEKL